MRRLRYYINVTLDGCCDHTAAVPTEATHRHAEAALARADALIFGRVVYQMMEEAWRPVAETGVVPDWMDSSLESFAHTIHRARKYVVSSTLERVDWNAELLRGDIGAAVRELKEQSGDELLVSGLQLPLELADLGLIDEYEFVVHPRLAGHGPTLFDGLSKYIDLEPIDRLDLGSGVVAIRYVPR